MDILGDHALCCKSLGVYGRHNALRNAVVSLACEAGCHVYPEAPLPSTFERPAEALIEGLDPDGPVAVDVAITHTLQPSISLAAASDEMSIAHVELRKKSQYESLCAENGWRFVPCVASTAGTWGVEARKLLSRLIRKRALTLGTSFSDEARYVWEYVNSCILYSISRQLAGRGTGYLPPSQGCAKKKIGVAEFGVFFVVPLGIPSDLHGHLPG